MASTLNTKRSYPLQRIADYPSGWRLTMASELLTTSLFRFHEPVTSECDPCRKSSGIVKTDK